jgi:putative glutamine amidotransferase
MKPLIGISSYDKTILVENIVMLKHINVHHNYAKAVTESGGIPIILHSDIDEELAAQYADRLDALILTGGSEEISPLYYQDSFSIHTTSVNPKRDKGDILLMEAFEKLDKPILGVCRGHQLINVARGGSLYSNLKKERDNSSSHWGGATPIDYPVHHVNIVENTPHFEIFNKKRLAVNSFHYQAVKGLGKGLIVSAKSDDGIIEGIYDPNHKFIVGIQWHPEMMALSNDEMLKVFKFLVKKAASPL